MIAETLLEYLLQVVILVLIGIAFRLSLGDDSELWRRFQHTRHTNIQAKTEKTGKKYLVVGGHGFLGSHIVEALLERGETDIVIFDVADSPLFEDNPFVKTIRGDITKAEQVSEACVDVDTVFHTAACINFWSRLPFDYPQSFNVNYIGTKNIVEACIGNGVKELIFTSSFVVCFDLKNSLVNADESLPYATRPCMSHYIDTKILAEKEVIKANGKNGLKTGCVRPSGGIYGPRDTIVTKMFMEASDSLLVSPGKPHVKQDWIYVENVVHAHLCMEASLQSNAAVCCGKAYFVNNEEPITYGDFLDRASVVFNYKTTHLPDSLLVPLAYLSELISWLTVGALKTKLTLLTPSSMVIPRTEYYFNASKAKKELNYTPIYSVDDGLQKTIKFCKSIKSKSA